MILSIFNSFVSISVVSNCHVMEVCLVMAVLPLHGSSCFHLTAEPNFPDLPHTPWSCRKWCYQIFQHSILLLAFRSRNKSPGMPRLILPSPIKKMMYFFRYTEEIQKISNYSWNLKQMFSIFYYMNNALNRVFKSS